MDPETFAAQRRAVFVRADEELEPFVERALLLFGRHRANWDRELIEAASVIWLEVFAAEAPHADPARYMKWFQDSLTRSLAETRNTGVPPEDASVDRVTRWVGTFTVNDATYRAVGARGVRNKRWTTMHDSAVREPHVLADGQVRPVAAPFNVGGYELRFPGDPVGPPEIWINCRCVIQPAAPRGEANVSPTTFAIDEKDLPDTEPLEEVPDEDIPADELEEDEEEVTEIPVHGVLAPEGVPTGDGRQFAVGALTHRELPLPIAYQVMSAEGHLNSVTVGRIDEVFREGSELRFRGALMVGREKTAEVIEGIIDGTVRGVSMDVDNVVVGNMSDEGDFGDGLVEFSEARIAGVTIVPIPAFQEAFVALGHEFLSDLPDEAKEALAACGCQDGPDDEDENPDIEMGYDAYRTVSAEERKRLAGEGKALPDGSFPIANVEDLRNAIQAIGRASDPAAAKAHIKKRARALGHPELIPEGWAEEVVSMPVTDPHSEAKLAVEVPTFAAGTKDGPGWITHPIPTSRIRRYWTHGKGAAKIRWGAPGDFNRCRRQLAKYVTNPQWLAGTCANMHKEALGIWPSTHAGKTRRGHALAASGVPAPIFTLVASASRVFPAEYFTEPDCDPSVGVEVNGDRIYGYIAQWGVCHIGIDGMCTTPPPATSGYGYYATGIVHTDDGGKVRVGQITMDTGHANLKANHRVAAAHYDNTGAAVADIAVGENDRGIWFSGVLRRSTTDDQVHALEASGRLSGDWRKIGGEWQLVAALAVNVPGFPIPEVALAASGGEQYALVAAGIVPVSERALVAAVSMDADTVASIVRTAVDEYRHSEKRAARTAPLRDALRQKRIESLRTKIKE